MITEHDRMWGASTRFGWSSRATETKHSLVVIKLSRTILSRHYFTIIIPNDPISVLPLRSTSSCGQHFAVSTDNKHRNCPGKSGKLFAIESLTQISPPTTMTFFCEKCVSRNIHNSWCNVVIRFQIATTDRRNHSVPVACLNHELPRFVLTNLTFAFPGTRNFLNATEQQNRTSKWNWILPRQQPFDQQ